MKNYTISCIMERISFLQGEIDNPPWDKGPTSYVAGYIISVMREIRFLKEILELDKLKVDD